MNNVIDQGFFDVTLKFLRISTLQIISKLLNPVKYIPNKENLPRDWRGLADLTKCTCEDTALFNCTPDPTLNVLKKWCEQDDSTIKKLLLYFQKLDRFDIYDDVITLVITDIHSHKTESQNNVDTSLFITLKDHELYRQGLPPTHYDASVLYAQDDSNFAAEVVTILEQKYNLQIFMKERDLIGGTIEHNATMQIIANRCHRLIIIISPAFLMSSENKYFIKFAQSIEIDQRKRKILPCIYKDCELPYEVKHLHKLSYSSFPVYGDFYEKLYRSIASATVTIPRSLENISTLRTSGSTNNLPQAALKQLQEHNSLPDTEIQETNDTISKSSLAPEQTNKKNTKLASFFRKKIFKKKRKALIE